MQGVFYLLAIVAVSIVFYWFVRNDRNAEGNRTSGLLAYKEGPEQQTGKRKKRAKGKGQSKRAYRTGTDDPV